ncbi:type I-E CRISPR-associated protein Cas6/Cse3/CasE [Streptomyces sp. NPDC051453]|uniref:type I-E CRISPR-associated protein Cas6/Cse3/CasE n=1 Tax=Streptomyces sp. NPDC051453 TaxID=3154941 RepID=UPI0034407B51
MSVVASDSIPSSPAVPDCCVLYVWRSKIILSARASAACEDAHAMHQLVERGVRDDPALRPAGQQHTAYAAERQPSEARRNCGLAGRPVSLLVQSAEEPDWSAQLKAGIVESVSSERIRHTWRRGDRAEIQVSASPLVKRHGTSGKILLHSPEECRSWFRGHLERAGCKPIAKSIFVTDPESMRQRWQTITLRGFRATAKIADPARFHELLVSGMGRNRAWGAGLVLASPTEPRGAQ